MGYWINTTAAMKYYMLATQSGDREVGGYAKFRIDEHENVIVEDLRVIRQDSTECYFEISDTENAKFLEQLVADGEDPKDWGMLFHTHPSGMGASMSGVDVKMLTEMAKDLPGQVARSMILSMGKMNPTMHEAVCMEGRVFLNDDVQISLLDATGATADLKKIGWFDKPKVDPKKAAATQAAKRQVGFTHEYGQGAQRSSYPGGNSRELVPTRRFDKNDGWYDEQPERSEAPMETAEYSSWLDDAWSQRADEMKELDDLDKKDQHDALMWDAAEVYIGETVIYKGDPVAVIDAYVWSNGKGSDEIVLVLPDNSEVTLTEVTMPEKVEQQSA